MNEKILQGFLIAVIVLGSGYLVYSFVAPASEITEVIEVNEEEVIENSEIFEWITYRNEEQGFSVAYPSDWTRKQESHIHSFTSSDYAISDTGEIAWTVDGVMLEIFATTNSFNKSIDLDLTKEAQLALGGEYKLITIDGEEALWSTIKTHGSYMEAKVYLGTMEYLFRLNVLDEDNPDSRKLFDDILAMVDFLNN